MLNEDLGCASYLIADGGEAAIVDPQWDIAEYLRLAAEHGFRIGHILETHNHADHVSGHGRLAGATGATIYVPAEANAQFPHRPLSDADVVQVGDARIAAIATPGHRPEHLSFAVADTGRSPDPWILLSGDSLFVADVARPDLAVDPDEGARGLFRSVTRLLELGDVAELWPGHVGGSLCGGAGMSEKPASTIGFERRFNPFLRTTEEAEFVRLLTADLAPQPPNFRRIVELNRGPLLTESVALEPIAPRLFDNVVIDGRDPREFDAEHIPGSINVTMTKGAVGTRAAWVVDSQEPVVLVAAGDDEARRMALLLEAVGFRSLRGYLTGGIAAWHDAGLDIESTPAIDIKGLADHLRAGDVRLLDVREEDEWEAGHVPGSFHVPYHDLRDGLPAGLQPNGKPLAVACSAGNRSSIAVSLLRRAGVDDLIHVADGGIADLADEDIDLVRGK